MGYISGKIGYFYGFDEFRRGRVTKMHCLFSSAVITFASPLRGGKGGVFVNTKMQRRCGFYIRILLHRLWRSPLSEGASYIRSPVDSRDGEGIPFCGGSKPPPYENDT